MYPYHTVIIQKGSNEMNKSSDLRLDPKRKQSVLKEILKNRSYYIMALPGILALICFAYIPYYYMQVAFKDFNFVDGLAKSPWVGFKNFKYFFESGDALKVTGNTLILNTYFMVAGLISSVALAIFVNEIPGKKFRKITQTMYFFPYFLSWVIIGEIIYNIFSSDFGVMNNILSSLGLAEVAWYRHPEYWRSILVLSNIWKGTGYGSLIYLSTMAGFDASLYEAAEVDGANKLQKIFRLTIPMLKPTMIVLTLFSIGRIFFGDFSMILAVIKGPTMEFVKVIDIYVYNMFKTVGSVGLGNVVAIGLYQSVFGFIVIVVTNKLAKRFNDGSALF